MDEIPPSAFLEQDKQAEVRPAEASSKFISSVTFAGGDIRSKHFQSGTHHLNERHQILSARINTNGYGSLGIYSLSPNSERRDSIGIAYMTDPYKVQLPAGMSLEASLVAGVVTGYQGMQVAPMLGGNLRLNLYETTALGDGKLSIGIEASALVYRASDDKTNKQSLGVVGTTPYLGIRYEFNESGGKTMAVPAEPSFLPPPKRPPGPGM